MPLRRTFEAKQFEATPYKHIHADLREVLPETAGCWTIEKELSLNASGTVRTTPKLPASGGTFTGTAESMELQTGETADYFGSTGGLEVIYDRFQTTLGMSWEEATAVLRTLYALEQDGFTHTVPELSLSDAEYARRNLIPGETTFALDGRTFRVSKLEPDIGRVELQDVTFANAVGFPIFRVEPISVIRQHLEQKPEPAQPGFTTEPVTVYPGDKNHLPYDVVVQTLRTNESEPPTSAAEPEKLWMKCWTNTPFLSK